MSSTGIRNSFWCELWKFTKHYSLMLIMWLAFSLLWIGFGIHWSIKKFIPAVENFIHNLEEVQAGDRAISSTATTEETINRE